MSTTALLPRVDRKVSSSESEADTESETLHGRTKVSAKAIARIVAAITGESFGVPARTVGVQLDDSSGLLAVTATTGISVRSLVSTRAPAQSGSLLERASAAQNSIRTRTSELTGSLIGPVTVRLSSAIIEGEDRAR